MKTFLIYSLAAALLLVTSCQREENMATLNRKTIGLFVEVDEMGSGLQTNTRTVTIEPLDNEVKVKDLYLLFFKTDNNGLANFTGYYKKTGDIDLRTKFLIEYSQANTGNYSVLAFANAEGYTLNGAASIDDYLAGLTAGTSINQVMKETQITAGTEGIKAGSILMSGRTEKPDGQHLMNLKLTRCVSRFDVQVLDKEYELASIAIWNNAENTPLWVSSQSASEKISVNPAAFYSTGTFAAGIKEYKGLYAFENYQSDPSTGDKVTTCLIIGLRKPNEIAAQFYRINIHPQESGQSLKRNYVYQVTVRNVLGTGPDREDKAYESAVEPNLNIDINNWNLDDEGLILTDGKNTMAVPSKIIRFQQEGGRREYTIFTQGEGTLSMSPKLPSGFNASLKGNQLTVTATDLGSLSKREGTLDLSFAGLKGTVQIIQQPKELHFLKLDKNTVSGFPAARTTDFTGTLTVTSSKAWKATIYNTSGSGFSFDKDDGSQTTATGASGDEMQLYIAKDNLENRVITGFLLVSLVDEPGYNRVVMLKQSPSPGISIDLGELTSLGFKANGATKTNTRASTANGYTLTVDPGKDVNGTFYEWGAQLTGSHSDKFELIVDKSADLNRVTILPKGHTASGSPHAQYPRRNYTRTRLDDVKLQVYWGDNLAAVQSDPAKYKEVPVLQDAVVLNASEAILSKKGETKNIPIEVSEGFSWNLKLVSTEDFTGEAKYANMDHRGYIVNGTDTLSAVNDELTNQTASALKVGFNKILFPLVKAEPKMSLQLSLTDEADTFVDFDVKQEPLMPKPVNVTNIDGPDRYGMLDNGTYFDGYKDYIANTNFFGPSSPYCYANVNITTVEPKGLSITNNVNYVHAGSTKTGGAGSRDWSSTTFNVINTWKTTNNEAIIVYVQDNAEDDVELFKNPPFNGNPYELADPRRNNQLYETSNTNITKYLITDGPFGTVDESALNDLGNVDGNHSSIKRKSFEDAGGVVIVTEETYTDNVLIGINPKENIVFIGEGALFRSGYTEDIHASTDAGSRRRFLANFLSYVVRAAQYGSHFTDHFHRFAKTYPFDKLKTTYPEPYY